MVIRQRKVKAEFRVVTQFGVSHLMNQYDSVAQFRSWQDVAKGTGGSLRGHTTHSGVPMTQVKLDTYYPLLKEDIGLTKSKIGSGKVRFKDLRKPIAVEYQGTVYLVAPYVPDTAIAIPRLPPVERVVLPPQYKPQATTPKRKPAARTTKPKAKKTTAAKTRKTTKKAAKPKAKKTAAAPKLTASQREYLAIQGFVMVKRGGKYVRITG